MMGVEESGRLEEGDEEYRRSLWGNEGLLSAGRKPGDCLPETRVG